MEATVRSVWRVAIGVAAAAMGAIVPLSGSFGQDWNPSFKSSGPAEVEVERRPKPAKRPKARAAKKQHQHASPPTRANKDSAPRTHKLVLQVSEHNPQLMNLALNNARNVVEHYKSQGEDVAVEIVTFGPGLHMLRDDTSPVKQRIAATALEYSRISFVACANTQANMSKQENKPIALVSEARVEPSGVVHLMQLKSKGYSYIRP